MRVVKTPPAEADEVPTMKLCHFIRWVGGHVSYKSLPEKNRQTVVFAKKRADQWCFLSVPNESEQWNCSFSYYCAISLIGFNQSEHNAYE